jgi:hypothetical protein
LFTVSAAVAGGASTAKTPEGHIHTDSATSINRTVAVQQLCFSVRF